ncbi:l-serine dehydratase, alpha subunit [hydrocarbon metagenome]|uniref:L-serine dehydratase, alpha subunit n=1 Tax=hydrocarbon metagenome TaxID=938273 RepID=A0A0W8E1B0_9ZZZZ
MYQFSRARELLEICVKQNLELPDAVLLSEQEEWGRSRDEIWDEMECRLKIMENSVQKGLEPGLKSIGGLIGGNAAKLNAYISYGSLGGRVINQAVAYALAVTEYNASMGKIVAAPTAGSSGILPGILIALRDDKEYSREQIINAMFVAGGVGKVIASNATLSGAAGGCQAECGAASAMAAASAAYLGGASPGMCMEAAAMALKGLLGLVCDPVGGLVEVPCSKRNATSAANAIICADMALAGISSYIPFDEVVDAMFRIGNMMSDDLRETARGGCAMTPTALEFAKTFRS